MTETLLVVDDDKEFREEMKDLFSEYRVLEAANGQEAVDMIRKANAIDLVILDVRMPRRGGIDVLREIKRTDPALGIIIMTGYSDKDTAIEALKGHADDYIEKPADPKKIRAMVETILEKQHAGSDIDTASTHGKIEKVKRFIERNCFKKTNLEDAAQAVCLSPKYLSRLFKEETGESYVQYRIKLKIEKAKTLLARGSDGNVSQIAYKLGYENPESFIRQFKRFTKKTPTEFRQKKTGKRSLASRPAARKGKGKQKRSERRR
ncbi:MAG: response regulator [Candidatus Omnitrophota bacterium]